MRERVAREVGREDPLQRLPPEHPLERVEPQRRLVVGDRAGRPRPVAPRRRRLHLGVGGVAVAAEAVAVGRAAERQIVEDPGHEPAEVPLRVVLRSEELLDGPRGRERIEALVHPRVLELVGRDDAVPELVAGFVHRDALRLRHRPRRQPSRARGEEHRILHAAGAALPGGIDHGDVPVGIRTEPLAVVAERGARRVEVPLRLADVLGLEQQAHRHVRQPFVGEPLDALHVVGARRPGEIVDVLRIIMMRRRTGRPRPAACARPRWPPRSIHWGPSAGRRRCRNRRRTPSRRGTGGSSSRCPRRRQSWETTARESSSCRSLPCARTSAAPATTRRSAR